jgi:hypothetical protein
MESNRKKMLKRKKAQGVRLSTVIGHPSSVIVIGQPSSVKGLNHS